jgi:energy-coupling factor transporter ATP-binding protein EcfA2
MPNGPQKLILINAGRYDYAEVELGSTMQIVGPNNTGKTSLINTLQFLYLDDRRQMDFGHSPEATRDYYFPNQYSYVLFECLGARGKFVLGWRGQSKAAGGEVSSTGLARNSPSWVS